MGRKAGGDLLDLLEMGAEQRGQCRDAGSLPASWLECLLEWWTGIKQSEAIRQMEWKICVFHWRWGLRGK